MAKQINFSIFLGTGLLLLAACGRQGQDLPNMKLTLSANEAAPGGAKAFKGMAYHFFEYANLATNNKPFNQWFGDKNNFHKKKSGLPFAYPHFKCSPK